MAGWKGCPSCGKTYISKYEDKCHECQLKEDIRYGYADETYDEKYVFCPHCGQEIDYRMTDKNLFTTAKYDMTCPNCKKNFQLSIYAEYHYSTKKI